MRQTREQGVHIQDMWYSSIVLLYYGIVNGKIWWRLSTFSAEFIALKVCLEAVEHLRFKLRCFGVPLPQGKPAHVFCDNESVVKNTTNVESTLNKKHSSVAYHNRNCLSDALVTLHLLLAAGAGASSAAASHVLLHFGDGGRELVLARVLAAILEQYVMFFVRPSFSYVLLDGARA
jgi:hypothetical protein